MPHFSLLDHQITNTQLGLPYMKTYKTSIELPRPIVIRRVPSEEDLRTCLTKNTQNLDFSNSQVPCCRSTPHWSVETYDPITDKYTTYTCKYLVLANGTGDLPNRLEVSEAKGDPSWLLYDVRMLEIELDRYSEMWTMG